MSTFGEVYWEKWRPMETVQLGDAAFLSLDVDPDSDFARELRNCNGSARIKLVRAYFENQADADVWLKKFDSRNEQFLSALGLDITKRPPFLMSRNDNLLLQKVELASVRMWCIKKNLPVSGDFLSTDDKYDEGKEVRFFNRLKTMTVDAQIKCQRGGSGLYLYVPAIPFLLERLLVFFGKTRKEPQLLKDLVKLREEAASSLFYKYGDPSLSGILGLVVPDDLAQSLKVKTRLKEVIIKHPEVLVEIQNRTRQT